MLFRSPCDFKVDHRVEKETEFLWLRDCDTVEYEEGDKYTLLANKSLLIRELELGDQAKYTCRVTNPLEETESHLQLIVSGMGPEIMNTFSKTTVYEGGDLHLECIARGSPQPGLQWLVREKPVLTKYLADITAAKSEFIEKRVRILGASRSHEGLYQCVASNTIGTVVKNAQVEVISRTRVSIASQDGDREITVQAGEIGRASCRERV